MAMQEIDEAELASLRNSAGLLTKALNSPKSREQILRGLKAANPELAIPEIDAAQPFNEALEGMNKRFDELAKQLSEEAQARKDAEDRAALAQRWNDGRSKAAKLGYSGESLEALEKFMEEKAIADHEIAAAAFEKMNPAPKPVSNTSGRFDFFGIPSADDNVSKAITDLREGKIGENQFLDFSVNEVLKEMRGVA